MKHSRLCSAMNKAGHRVEQHESGRYFVSGKTCLVEWSEQDGETHYVFVKRKGEVENPWSDSTPGTFFRTIKQAVDSVK